MRRMTEPIISVSLEEEIVNNNWYQIYNLLTYALQEFHKPIIEFSGFFSEFYPYLNKFISLVKADIKVHNL